MNNNVLNIYEWEWKKLPPDVTRKELEKHLATIWSTRQVIDSEFNTENTEESGINSERYKQGFVKFDGQNIGAKNYVGFIHYNGLQLNIYPKVFREQYPQPDGHQDIIMRNVLEWLSKSKRIKFPFADISFDFQKFNNFLEPFIFIFSEITLKKLQLQPYQRFEEVTEQTSFLRGRLALNEYLNNSVVTGNNHRLYSTYDKYEYNNKFNQIVKYVSNLLLSFTENQHSIRRLNSVLFLLDGVDDCICTYSDCNSIIFNRMYDGWESVLNMCRMFLSGSTISSNSKNKPNYCFLVPMELIFEEYVAGMLIDEFSDRYNVTPQKSDLYLVSDPDNIFNLQHDIYLTDRKNKTRSLIIDTKYKIRTDSDKSDKKMGISQADMYQMVSYAYRRGCSNVLLLYPNSTDINANSIAVTIPTLRVLNGRNEHEYIKVHIAEIPFWTFEDISMLSKNVRKVLCSLLSQTISKSW